MAVKKIGNGQRAPAGPQWNGGRPGRTFLVREEWRRSRQGKKVLDGRCGQPDEAKPVPGQTCPIETAPGELPSNVV